MLSMHSTVKRDPQPLKKHFKGILRVKEGQAVGEMTQSTTLRYPQRKEAHSKQQREGGTRNITPLIYNLFLNSTFTQSMQSHAITAPRLGCFCSLVAKSPKKLVCQQMRSFEKTRRGKLSQG